VDAVDEDESLPLPDGESGARPYDPLVAADAPPGDRGAFCRNTPAPALANMEDELDWPAAVPTGAIDPGPDEPLL